MKNEVFEQNPQLKKVFVTTDGTPFYQENDAKNHAKTLDDTTVEIVLNPDFLEVIGVEVVADQVNEMAEFEAQAKLDEELAQKEATEAQEKAAAALAEQAPSTEATPEKREDEVKPKTGKK